MSAHVKFDAAVTAMTLPENVYDVTIICTTDDHQAEFWMTKLSAGVRKAEGSLFPMVLAVSEDWSAGGAGNGLGTLYAWQKAASYASSKFDGVDLMGMMKEGKISAALYHTAGKGTRMAPLPASENNNKPGVVSVIVFFVLSIDFRLPSPLLPRKEAQEIRSHPCLLSFNLQVDLKDNSNKSFLFRNCLS